MLLGYRHIGLRSEFSQPQGVATVFVHIQVKDYIIDAFAGSFHLSYLWQTFTELVSVTAIVNFYITVNTVILQCCKANLKINFQMEDLTPCEMVNRCSIISTAFDVTERWT